MDNELLREHHARITRNYFRRMSNLVKLGRFNEARENTIRYSGILYLWEIQRQNMERAANKSDISKLTPQI